jgi:hypothetical protein
MKVIWELIIPLFAAGRSVGIVRSRTKGHGVCFLFLFFICSSVVPCVIREVMVSLDIRTQPCVFAGEPCGLRGICQETHKGLHFFTSCTCLGGQ